MLQTIEIPNFEWLRGNINRIIYDLEANECKVKDIRLITKGDERTYQILFESNEVITWKIKMLKTPRNIRFIIYDSKNEIMLEYDEFSI